LIFARRRFVSTICFLVTRLRFAFRLLSLDLSASARCFALRSRNANASINLSLARSLFASLVLSSCATTRIPVGTCRNTTLVSTFCTFCPPRPPDLENSSTKSLSSIFKGFYSIREFLVYDYVYLYEVGHP
jgi:hypothetical protein